MPDRKIVLVIHNVRSAHNVGAMFRTADGAGVDEIILTGYSAVPPKRGALYPTAAEKAFRKTALGAEENIRWKKMRSFGAAQEMLKNDGYEIVALEQDESSTEYVNYVPKSRVALVVGNEVRGVDKKILKRCDVVIEIPMYGGKNSLNVAVAAGIALYRIRCTIKGG